MFEFLLIVCAHYVVSWPLGTIHNISFMRLIHTTQRKLWMTPLPNMHTVQDFTTLAQSCSCVEPSLAFATRPTSKHQRVT